MDLAELKEARSALLAEKNACRKSNTKFNKQKELKALDSQIKELSGKGSERRNYRPGNDPAWWKKDPSLMSNASNIKSNYIPGKLIDVYHLPFNISGLYRYLFRACFGISSSATDPLNVWARDLYLRMFQKWRGISAYSASDLGIAILAQCEVVAMIMKLERIYGVVNRYSKLNINMPTVEVEALGLTQTQADWIRDHLSDYRYDLNALIKKAQRLCIPKDLVIIENTLSLLGYEYLDHDNVKGQIIIFDREYFFAYSDTDLTTGSSLTEYRFTMSSSGHKLIDTTSPSVGNMFDALSFLMDRVLGSDSVQRINGDLVTWFGEAQLLTIKPLVEDLVVAPVYSESINHKMHNIDPFNTALIFNSLVLSGLSTADKTYVSGFGVAGQRVIYQFNDAIVSAYGQCKGGATPSYHPFNGAGDQIAMNTSAMDIIDHATTVLDSYRVDVTEDYIIEGMLWKADIYKVSPTDTFTGNGSLVASIAFEQFDRCDVYTLDASGAVISTQITGTQSASLSAMQIAASNFINLDWAPICYVYVAGTNFTALLGELDTIIPVTANQKYRVQQACVYSGLQTDVKVIDKVHQ